ncbi:unnamed protein product [Tenebrio molitor]|nr:unnamed protein product [Tenebrio molitor]
MRRYRESHKKVHRNIDQEEKRQFCGALQTSYWNCES